MAEPNPVPPEAKAAEASKAEASPLRRIPAPVRAASLAAAGLAAIAGIIYIVLPGSPTSNTANPGGQATSTAIPGPMPGAPKAAVHRTTSTGVTSVTGTAVPTALRPTNPLAVKAWNSGPGGKALAQVTTLSGATLMANAGQQYSQMLLSCKALSSAVTSAQQAAPIQDASMQREYAAALSNLKLGAKNCVSGIRQVPDGVEDTVLNIDHTTLNTAVSQLTTGVGELYAATEILRKQ